MSAKRSLSFWFGLSFAVAGLFTVILEVYLATYGKEDIMAGVLQIPMALILLMLAIGLLVTREVERARNQRTSYVVIQRTHENAH